MSDLEHALEFLKENIDGIHKVKEWANAMGYSSSTYFSRSIRNRFGRRPVDFLNEYEYNRIIEVLRDNPDVIFFNIALECGYANDQAMYNFVKRYKGTSLKQLKQGLKTGS
ncbi:MAG: AraC family transcriptional regulator [Bacteroidota bacterium]